MYNVHNSQTYWHKITPDGLTCHLNQSIFYTNKYTKESVSNINDMNI